MFVETQHVRQTSNDNLRLNKSFGRSRQIDKRSLDVISLYYRLHY